MDDWQELLFHRYSKLNEKFVFHAGDIQCSKAELLEHIKKKDSIYELLLAIEKNYFHNLKTNNLL